MDTARYAELFLTESREQLSTLNDALLRLERDGDATSIEVLFRAMHSVKG
jgi:chemotaxis protein histidine kinase CheA